MPDVDPKASLRTMRMIYFGMLFMPVALILVVLNTVEEELFFEFSLQDSLVLALVLLTLFEIPASIIVPGKLLKSIRPGASLPSKLAVFQSALIIRAAMWEGVALFAIVVFMMSGNTFPLLIAVVSLLVIASNYPGIGKLQSTLDLTTEEIQKLNA